MTIPQYNIIKMINEVYSAKLERNDNYSKRAFARDLGLSPGALVQIMKGERRVSRKMATKLCDLLEIAPAKKEDFFESFIQDEKVDSIEFDFISPVDYEKINKWYCFAILSLIELPDFLDDALWISRRLGVNEEVIKDGLKNLLDLKIIGRNQEGKLIRLRKRISTTDGKKDESIQKAHLSTMKLAMEKLVLTDVDLRDFTAMTFSIDPERLPEAKKMIRRFYNELSSFLDGGDKKEIYKMAIQFFPLTKKVKNYH